jgi:NAD-dependent dihydropyrimidine dehydrogenase PreA subunit
VPFVITAACVGVKDASCAEVCPVDWIHPAPDEEGHAEAEQLFIDPDECIDCDACREACPVDAIFAGEDLPPDLAEFAGRNAAHYA